MFGTIVFAVKRMFSYPAFGKHISSATLFLEAVLYAKGRKKGNLNKNISIKFSKYLHMSKFVSLLLNLG